MKKFQILRYLKNLRYFIVVVALVGSAAVYYYAKTNQTYTAEAVIEYANPGAEAGKTPSGDNIDSTEIYSAAVITDVIKDLGLSLNVDNIRAACTVSEVIPEDEQTRKDALLAEGEKSNYIPTAYRVTYSAGSRYSKGFVRNVLDSMISNYFTFYSEKYIDQSTVPNNVSNVSVEKYDYLDCVEMLDDATEEIEAYLQTKDAQYPNFRSAKTGYSFGDLKDYYSYISQNTIPSYYATVLDNKLTQDQDALIKRYENRISNYDIEIENLGVHIDKLTELAQQYGDKITKSESTVAGATGDNTDAIIENVEFWQTIDARINVDTTYDDLIGYLVDLKSQKSKSEVERTDCAEKLEVFRSAAAVNTADQATVAALSKDIDATVGDLGELYAVLVSTADEFNEYNGALNVSTLTSTYVTEGIDVNLYLELAILLFLILGCAGAVVLGRLGDFVDYFMYTDRKTGIANRSKVDAVVDGYSQTPLGERFVCVALRLSLTGGESRQKGRQRGDLALKEFGRLLKEISKDYGFVGYNNGELFLAFFENCSGPRAQEFLSALKSEADAYNQSAEEEILHYSAQVAESTADNTYDVRELMRLAIRRLNSPGPNGGKPADGAADSARKTGETPEAITAQPDGGVQ